MILSKRFAIRHEERSSAGSDSLLGWPDLCVQTSLDSLSSIPALYPFLPSFSTVHTPFIISRRLCPLHTSMADDHQRVRRSSNSIVPLSFGRAHRRLSLPIPTFDSPSRLVRSLHPLAPFRAFHTLGALLWSLWDSRYRTQRREKQSDKREENKSSDVKRRLAFSWRVIQTIRSNTSTFISSPD